MRNVQVESIAEAYEAYQTLMLGDLFPYITWIKTANRGNLVYLPDALDLMRFDRALRRAILHGVEVIEKQVKAQYRNAMRSRYGDECLCDPANFLNRQMHSSTMLILNRELHRRSRNDRVLFKLLSSGKKAHCDLALGALSFGAVSRLIGNTKSGKVLKDIGASFEVDPNRLKSWVRTLTAARNACAHFESYSVKKQIPSIPFRVQGSNDDHAAPLYILLLVDVMLAGRISYLGYDDGSLQRFRLEAKTAIGDLARVHPDYVESLRIPVSFKLPVPQPERVVKLHRYRSRVLYWTVRLAS